MTDEEIIEALKQHGRDVQAYHAVVDAEPFVGFGSIEYINVANAQDESYAELLRIAESLIEGE